MPNRSSWQDSTLNTSETSTLLMLLSNQLKTDMCASERTGTGPLSKYLGLFCVHLRFPPLRAISLNRQTHITPKRNTKSTPNRVKPRQTANHLPFALSHIIFSEIKDINSNLYDQCHLCQFICYLGPACSLRFLHRKESLEVYQVRLSNNLSVFSRNSNVSVLAEKGCSPLPLRSSSWVYPP